MAEDWYENLAPSVTSSWFTLVLHFHMKWLRASPDSLLERELAVIAPPGTATLTVAELSITNANTATTTVPAHTITAAPTIFETPTPPEPPSQTVDIQNIMTAELASVPTTATTTPCEDEPQHSSSPTTNSQEETGGEEEAKMG